MHDHVITGDPVDGGGDTVLVAGLERVDDAEHFGRVAARRRRVREDETDGLLGVDDEHRADGEGDALLVDVGRVLVVEPAAGVSGARRGGVCADYSHVIEIGHLAGLVADDGEAQPAARDLVDVLDPAVVAVDGVCGEADQLDAAPGELGLELGKGAQLRRADGRVILRVREQDDPVVADELVEVDRALRRFGLEIGGDGAQT